jgi:hypothetical protein
MTTTTYPSAAGRGIDRDTTGLTSDINTISQSPNGSIAVLLMNEALARVRMREATEASNRPVAVRPARLIAMLADKRRNRI